MSKGHLLFILLAAMSFALTHCSGRSREQLPDGPLVEGHGVGIDPFQPSKPGEDQGTLERSEVDAVLNAGPQEFIKHVRVSPALLAGKFIGFRLVEFFPGDPRFARVDLHPGDVVTRVNGLPIERPEQVMKVWETLKVADELKVEYIRGGMVKVLRWKIVDSKAMPTKLID